MPDIQYIERTDRSLCTEPVYGGKALDFVYGETLLARLVGRPILHILLRTSLFSWYYGAWQKSRISKKKVLPFIESFKVDTADFLEPTESYSSFNDFFIRKLKSEARPIANAPFVIPADGRYRFIPRLNEAEGILVKGQMLDLPTLLGDPELAGRYEGGSMVMARLCPTDYHRFHFPCDNTPGDAQLINGWLYSVNPIATRKRISIFSENKRKKTLLQTDLHGTVTYLEIGATCVGSIAQTYHPNQPAKSGEEKGYFSFGASALILLFEPNSIQFDPDLLELSRGFREIRCLMGQSMGS